jgi:Glycosyltransferase family 9 (heptosyltransferase)
MRNVDTRPLVVRCGAFGDMVLITTLVRELSARFGRDVDIVTSGPWSAPLLEGQPGVGEVLTVRSRKTPYWLSRDQQHVVRRLRTRGAMPTWYCDGNDAARPMLIRAGIPEQYIVDVKDHPLLPGEHATQQWYRLAHIMPAALAGVEMGQPHFEAGSGGCQLEVSAQARAELEIWLEARKIPRGGFFAVQMGNKRTMRRGLRRLAVNHKYWPQERWAAVLEHLRQRHPNHAILLLGTGPEFLLNEALAASVNIERLYNVADDLPVQRLVALLARADGLVNVDSGPAHAAAAVGCPEVVLFGKASTSLYRPWGLSGGDVKVLTGQIDGVATMLGITPDQVIQAWDALRLGPTPPK